MTTAEPIYVALKRLEGRDLVPEHADTLRPAFAALHGGQAIALPEHVVKLIRMLDPGEPVTTN